MRSLLAALMLASVVLAGCAEEPAAPQEEDDDFGIDVEATDETGVIRGVVVNEAIVPLAKVQVDLVGKDQSMQTDENGYFAFEDLEPGSYFLEASRIGYKSQQASVDVEAGISKPPIKKILLQADPDAKPYAVTHVFEGFLQCGTGTGGVGSTNPCFMAGSDNVRNHEVDKPLAFSQSELIWEGTSALGDDMSLGYYDPNTLASNFAGAVGPSPVILRVDQEQIEAALGTSYQNITVRVFPGASQPATVTFDQRFTVYTTFFYGFEPEEDWRFIEDGEYPAFE